VRLASAAGRWVLAVAVLGEAMVLLEATVVNVALPAIGRDLGAGVAGLQWTLNGYVLTLAALVLAAGSLSDLYGRRRVFTLGVGAFVAASALCAAAPTIQLLIAARFVQGVGGALLTPGSLAIIDAVFHPDDRTRAIGAWAGLTAVAAAVGPPVGGYLTDALSWRAIFLINLPLGVFVIIAAVVKVPESRNPTRAGGLDLPGAALVTDGSPPGAHASGLAERPHVNLQSAVHLGEGRSHLAIALLRERCGQVLREPVQILADDPADLLVARGPMPGVRRRPGGPGRHARQRRHAERQVLVCEQLGPGSQIVEELVEHRVQSVCLGNPAVSLPHVQNPVNDLAEHLVEGGGRIVAPGLAHAGTVAYHHGRSRARSVPLVWSSASRSAMSSSDRVKSKICAFSAIRSR
jgi:Major Facilitator Superfamily